MKEFLKRNKEKIFNIIIFLIYVIITGITVINHEAYEDEAQSWLVLV